MPDVPDGNKLIVLEFNELTPRLMTQFIEEGVLPNFARMRRESAVYLTDAGEDPPNLNPWVQWVTAHSGVPASQHQVINLGDASKAAVPRIWEVVSDNGGTVWVCGSMNAAYKSGVNGLVLPDPWSVRVRPSHAELVPYFDFVRSNVLEYTRERMRIGLRQYLSFSWFMVLHGAEPRHRVADASPAPLGALGRTRWRRATILDRLQFDVFRHYYHKLPSDIFHVVFQ